MNNWKDINSIFDNQQFKEFVKLLNVKLKILKITENDLKSAFVLPLSQGGTGQSLGAGDVIVFTWLQLTGLDADRVIYADSNKELKSTNISGGVINYLDGVSSNIQGQLNDKIPYNSVTDTFTTVDGKTVTVQDGQITSIV